MISVLFHQRNVQKKGKTRSKAKTVKKKNFVKKKAIATSKISKNLRIRKNVPKHSILSLPSCTGGRRSRVKNTYFKYIDHVNNLAIEGGNVHKENGYEYKALNGEIMICKNHF